MKILSNQQNIIINKSIKLLKGHVIPNKSYSYNYKKIIDNKGIIKELYQFKDSLGKILKEIEHKIKGDSVKEIKVITYSTNKNTDIKRTFIKDIRSGKIAYIKEESFPCNEGLFSYIEKIEQGKPDEHKVRFNSIDGIQKEISYKTKWDGKKPKVTYKNIKGKLPEEGLEYLPIIVSEGSINRVNHIAKIQINSYSHLKNLANLPILKSCEELNSGMSITELKKRNLSICNGRAAIFDLQLLNTLKEPKILLDVLSHEYQHIADKIGMNKILSKINKDLLKKYFMAILGKDSFNDLPFTVKRNIIVRLKCLKTGIITPLHSKFKEYRELSKDIVTYKSRLKKSNNSAKNNYEIYRENPLEKRAFAKGEDTLSKYYNLLISIKELMTTV